MLLSETEFLPVHSSLIVYTQITAQYLPADVTLACLLESTPTAPTEVCAFARVCVDDQSSDFLGDNVR